MAKYCDEHVCLCVCLSVREDISETTKCDLYQFFCACCLWSWLGRIGHVLRHSDLIVHEVMFFQVDTRCRGRRRYLVADMVEDIRDVSNFANRDKHHQRLQRRLPSFRGTSQRSGPLQGSKVCQAILHRVPKK